MTNLGEVVTKIIDGRVRSPSPSTALVQVHVLVPLEPLTRVVVVQLELAVAKGNPVEGLVRHGQIVRTETEVPPVRARVPVKVELAALAALACRRFRDIFSDFDVGSLVGLVSVRNIVVDLKIGGPQRLITAVAVVVVASGIVAA